MRTPSLLSLVLLIALEIVAGCQKQPMTLEFVIPNGFSGVLKLRADAANGVELMPTNGAIKLVFPASGALDVKGELPTLEWHKATARFANETLIPIPGPNTTVPGNTLALRGL